MSFNFSSWQFFNDYQFINQSQKFVLNELIEKYNFNLVEDYIDIPDESLIYSYIINQNKPVLNKETILINNFIENIYLKYELAVNNIISYNSSQLFNLNDIKGFSIMDYILVPSTELKSFIEKKIPNIDKNKIIFMPFQIELIEQVSKVEKNILCISENDLKNKKVQNYLKIKNLNIYTDNVNLIKNLLPNKKVFDRKNLYYDLEKNTIVIDFFNDFLSSIIQKKSIVNSIQYYGSKNIYSNFKELNNQSMSFLEMEKEYFNQVNQYSQKLKIEFSIENLKYIMLNFLEKLQNNHQKIKYYLYQEQKKNLSYQKQVNKILKQLPKKYIYLDQELNLLNELEIKNKINQLLNQYQYIIIVEKSDKDYQSILNDFNIIKLLNFGSSELKLSNKEMQMIIISKDYFSNNKIYITWEGYQFFHISLAVINRELEMKLIKNPDYELSIISQDYYQEISQEYQYYNDLEYCINKPLLKDPDFYIKHLLPSGFISPDKGKYILIFPWEAGLIPKNLVNHINTEVDELWCPSEYIKSLHINSGVVKRKIQVIPNGIDLEIFKPIKENNKFENKITDKKFKFLFVGGILFRKGLDLILESYLSEFNIDDDVCLILKGLGQNTYYSSDKILKLLNNIDSTKAEIIFINENLSDNDLAHLYSYADVYIHPYRAEGFGMPIFEAMACGTPPITTRYGPSLEYCNDENAFLVDYYSKENILEQTFIEPSLENIRNLMRIAYENSDLVKSKAEKATEAVKFLSWDNIFDKIDLRFKTLKDLPEYRKNKNFYIDYLKEQIQKDSDNSDLLSELKIICEINQYKEILAQERFLKIDYKESLRLYSELFNLKKDTKYKENIYHILNIMSLKK